MEPVRQILPAKLNARGLELQGIDMQRLEQRRFKFEKDWERRLHYLVVNQDVRFEEAWDCVLNLLNDISGSPGI